MRCLVTGGAGFIGSHVVDNLRRMGIEVRIFDLRRSEYAPDCDHFIGSILDVEALRLAMNGVHAVFHLAAIADVKDVHDDPVYSENINVRGTISVLDAARRSGVERVIYGSTTWVYSDAEGDVVDEETSIPPPAHLYTATKLTGEYYCRSYSDLYGIDYTIFRYGIPYGPRARDGAVIPIFVGKALRGEPLTISGDGMQFRKFVYVEDLERGLPLDGGGDGAALGHEYLVVGAGGQRADRHDGLEKILILVAVHLGAQLVQQRTLQDALDGGTARSAPTGAVVHSHISFSSNPRSTIRDLDRAGFGKSTNTKISPT